MKVIYINMHKLCLSARTHMYTHTDTHRAHFFEERSQKKTVSEDTKKFLGEKDSRKINSNDLTVIRKAI